MNWFKKRKTTWHGDVLVDDSDGRVLSELRVGEDGYWVYTWLHEWGWRDSHMYHTKEFARQAADKRFR